MCSIRTPAPLSRSVCVRSGLGDVAEGSSSHRAKRVTCDGAAVVVRPTSGQCPRAFAHLLFNCSVVMSICDSGQSLAVWIQIAGERLHKL